MRMSCVEELDVFQSEMKLILAACYKYIHRYHHCYKLNDERDDDDVNNVL